MLRIIINGANGKMGRVVAELAALQDGIAVVAGIDKYPASGALDFPVFENFKVCNVPADVIIDFSRPEALNEILGYAVENSVAVVFCTTGYSEEDVAAIQEAAFTVPIFRSANMSLGINLMMDLIQQAASFFGNSADIEIVERHHNKKVDAPSGTALMLADAINEVFLNEKQYSFGRHTKTDKRLPTELSIHAIRGGTIIGDHEVQFLSDDEVVEIRHSAQSRKIYANGALSAAKFLLNKAPSLYNMKDLLHEKSLVTNLYVDTDVAMITIKDMPASAQTVSSVFTQMAKLDINLDMISQTAPIDDKLTVSFTLPMADEGNAVKVLEAMLGDYVHTMSGVIKLSVEGTGMQRQSGVAARVFELLAGIDVPVRMITTSETKISICIDVGDKRKAMAAIRGEFGF